MVVLLLAWSLSSVSWSTVSVSAVVPGHASTDVAVSAASGPKPTSQQDDDALGPRLRRGLRYLMLDADHVVGVGVMAQEFNCIPRGRRRVAVLSGPAGKELARLPSSHLGMMPHR